MQRLTLNIPGAAPSPASTLSAAPQTAPPMAGGGFPSLNLGSAPAMSLGGIQPPPAAPAVDPDPAKQFPPFDPSKAITVPGVVMDSKPQETTRVVECPDLPEHIKGLKVEVGVKISKNYNTFTSQYSGELEFDAETSLEDIDKEVDELTKYCRYKALENLTQIMELKP